MVQDVPNLRAHVESRAQRPLWVLVAIIALGAVWYAFWGPGWHLACILPNSVAETLGLREFERSEAYSHCRTKALAGAH